MSDSEDIFANWNGNVIPLSEVRVSVLDRAFMFGDAVYELVRVYGGRVWRIDDHLERLSAGLQELKIPIESAVIKERLLDTLAHTREVEALCYIQVTRGVAPRVHHFPPDANPNCLIYVQPFDDPFVELRRTGASAITFGDIRWSRNDIKSTSLLANCMAADAASQSGCLEAILIDRDDRVTEGSHSSAFAVRDGRVIVSPSSPTVLPGITKRQVIELCQESGIEMEEARLTKHELYHADELFITATPEEIIPIISVDSKTIGKGCPGPITQRLQQQFQVTIRAWLEAEAVTSG